MRKTITNFSTYSDGAFESKVHTIKSSMTGNTYFPTPVPTLAEITAAAADYSAALIKAASGDRMEIADKNAKRLVLEELLITFCRYINLTANGNLVMLLSSGFDLSKDPEPVLITKPENIEVLNGLTPGELKVSVKAVKGARVYLHEYTTDSTLRPESWVQTISTTRKFTFINLQPGTIYYCRVGAAGTNNQLLYSDVISRMVV